jgi:hypothetical protein
MRGHRVTSFDIEPAFGCDITGDITDPDVWAAVLARGPYDGMVAGSPCEGFSVAAFRHSFACRAICRECGNPITRVSGEKWAHLGAGFRSHEPKAVTGSLTYTPKSATGANSLILAQRTIVLAAMVHPGWWVMENPVGLLRQLPFMAGLDRVTIDQCQYGNTAKKPTDLWGDFPLGWIPRPRCIASRSDMVTSAGKPYPTEMDPNDTDAIVPWRPNPDGSPCHEAGYRGSKHGTQGKGNAALRAVIPEDLSLDLCLAAEESLK